MLIAADGRPIRSNLILAVNIYSPAFFQLLSQTEYWGTGGKIAWVPTCSGHVHDILWACNDVHEPVPEWVRRIPYPKMVSTFLTTASASPWTKDPTWNNTANSIGALGNGGKGGTRASSSRGGAGGGGGEYAAEVNVVLNSNPAFAVGSGAGTTATTLTGTSVTLKAFPGQNASTSTSGIGGSGSSNTTHFNGGSGAGVPTSTARGGGGGGAAGPHGIGSPGVLASGGSGDNGNTAARLTAASGISGIQFNSTHGSGGGAGAASGGTSNGFAGGLYGGGGSGAADGSASSTAGTGSNGLLYLNWFVPLTCDNVCP